MKDNVILNLRDIDNSKVVDDDFPPTVPNLVPNTFSGIPTNAIHPTTSRQSKGRDIFCHIETNGFLYISQALRVEFFKSNNLWLLREPNECYHWINYITHPCQDPNNKNIIYFSLRCLNHREFGLTNEEKKTSARFQLDSKGRERHGAKFDKFFRCGIELIKTERGKRQNGKISTRHFFNRPDKRNYARLDFKDIGHNIWVNTERMEVKLDLGKGVYAGQKRVV